ncbi:hypothetical protein FKM82_019125 [Ascaphus truei]
MDFSTTFPIAVMSDSGDKGLSVQDVGTSGHISLGKSFIVFPSLAKNSLTLSVTLAGSLWRTGDTMSCTDIPHSIPPVPAIVSGTRVGSRLREYYRRLCV